MGGGWKGGGGDGGGGDGGGFLGSGGGGTGGGGDGGGDGGGEGGGGSGGSGGGTGGAGGGGLHSAASPAKSRLRPAGAESEPLYVTSNVMFTYPLDGRKNNCTARLACASVRFLGSLGFSASFAPEVKVLACRSILNVVARSVFPDDERSGDT